MNFADLTLFTVTFNSNLVTGLMLKSFYKQVGLLPRIVIADNGVNQLIDPRFKSPLVTIIDNSKQKITGDYQQCSKNHCSTIDYVLKHVITTPWVLLVDNDILFKPSVRQFLLRFDPTKYDCAGEIGWDDAPPVRLYPYFCLINVNKMKRDNISYFDNDRCIGKNSVLTGIKGAGTTRWYKDTGCSFLEDIQNRWAIQPIQLDDYIVHMKGTRTTDIFTFFTENDHLI